MNNYERVANIIRFLDLHHTEQPDLAELASVAGLSPFHFHRLFSNWAGVTPKDFLQSLTVELLIAGSCALLCGARLFSCRSGALCSVSRPVHSQHMVVWRERSGKRLRRARSAARWARIRSHSSFHVIA